MLLWVMFTPVRNGELIALNKNIETSDGPQKVALITPGEEIMYFSSTLPEKVIEEVEKANGNKNPQPAKELKSPNHIPSLLENDKDGYYSTPRP